MDIKDIADLLNKYPNIKENLKEMLNLVEMPSRGEFMTADAAEERAVSVIRKTGRNLMESWSKQQSDQASAQIKKQVKSAKKNIKKKSPGKQHLEK
jgi:hypothetical protein